MKRLSSPSPPTDVSTSAVASHIKFDVDARSHLYVGGVSEEYKVYYYYYCLLCGSCEVKQIMQIQFCYGGKLWKKMHILVNVLITYGRNIRRLCLNIHCDDNPPLLRFLN